MPPEEDEDDKVYHNPVDKKTYVAPAGWKAYHAESPPRPDEPGRKVKMGEVRLLTSEREMAARTSATEVAAFLREAERLADVAFGKSGKQFRVMVQFDCNPHGHEVKMAFQGDATQELLQGYYDALVAAEKLPVEGGEVSFQMELSVSP